MFEKVKLREHFLEYRAVEKKIINFGERRKSRIFLKINFKVDFGDSIIIRHFLFLEQPVENLFVSHH